MKTKKEGSLLSKKRWERVQGACSLYFNKTGYNPQKILPLKETSDTS